MELTTAERAILDRFYEKCRMAGGVRTGYMLRKQAICYIQDDHPDLDLEEGLATLTEKGLLLSSESGDLYYLAEPGAEALTALNAA